MNADYRALDIPDVSLSLFSHFQRRQAVNLCRRKVDDRWVIVADPFVDDWSQADYGKLVSCLKGTIAGGGAVFGAFMEGLSLIHIYHPPIRDGFEKALPFCLLFIKIIHLKVNFKSSLFDFFFHKKLLLRILFLKSRAAKAIIHCKKILPNKHNYAIIHFAV